jgi:hypothetical protein
MATTSCLPNIKKIIYPIPIIKIYPFIQNQILRKLEIELARGNFRHTTLHKCAGPRATSVVTKK